MLKNLSILFVLCCVTVNVYAQHEWDTWYFGAGAGLDFSSNPPEVLLNGELRTQEGCASISDRETGEILFYSDGITIWNKLHQVMKNGTGLKGHWSAAQAAIIIPHPGSLKKYFLFTAQHSASQGGGYFYNEIDMELDGGNGAVISNRKNIPLYAPGSEKMSGVKHCNGIEYWVITHGLYSAEFYIYLVTKDGVSDPIIQTIGSYIDWGANSWQGQGSIDTSIDGKKVLHTIGAKPNGKNSLVEIFSFDNATGELTLENSITRLGGIGRASFSPSGELIYVTTQQGDAFGLFQFDLMLGNDLDINNSMYKIHTSDPLVLNDLQITPNKKEIFVSEFLNPKSAKPTKYLSIIRNPDNRKAACNFEYHAIDLSPNKSFLGLPTLIFNEQNTVFITDSVCSGDSKIIRNQIYNEMNPNGVDYVYKYDSRCDSILDTVYYINLKFMNNIESSFTQTLCPGQSITIQNNTFNESNPSGQIIIPNGAIGGCDSIINVNITFDATAVSTSIFETELCQEDEITINGTIYNKDNPSGTEIIPNGAVGGCDSVIQVNIIFLDTPTGQYENSYCQGYEVEINGTIYNENHPSGIEIFENASSKGCDSTTFINLTFDGVFTVLDPIFCPNDAIEINGTIYDENNPIGTEIFVNGSAFGCDSTVEINLQFYNDTAFIDTVFCNLDDSLVLGNQVFTIDNPQGQFALPNASFVGCDSIIDVQILYQIDSNFVADTMCWYDSLFVNGHFYTSENPIGIENMKSLDGCDSIVDLRLFFPYESVDLEIIGPDTVCYGETVILNAISNLENPSYDWYKNDSLICENCADVTSRVIKADVFSLFAEDRYGCELFLDQHRIQTQISYDVYFPNAITPNGDGINDKFTVYGNKKVDNVISMTIYDRWGEELFVEKNFPVNDTHHGWDGFFDGRVMQPGVYVYVVFVEFIDGTVKEYVGDLTVLL